MLTEPEFNRFSIALRDFEKSVEFSEEALRHSPDNLVYEALVFSAIVSYFRPFTPNEKSKNASATSKLSIQDFLPLTTEELELHTTCEKLRNKALAHSEYELNPTKLNPKTDVISSRPFSLFAPAPNMASLAALSKNLANQCHSKRASHVCSNTP